jgi:AbiV family abortive infection protein
MTTNTPSANAQDVPQNNAHVVARGLCLSHAANLIAAAERVLKDNGFPNIAYHLALLALEEIGKASMISSRAALGNARDADWMDKRFEDHVWKIQWAVWSPALNGRIDPADFEEARRFAQSMHARRLRGLYVDPNSGADIMDAPRAAVRLDQATSVLNMARARLDMENAVGAPDLSAPNEDLKWFLDTMNDQSGVTRILSKAFVDKFQELKGDPRAWVMWARHEFEKIDADEKAHLQKELARLPSTPDNAKPKWVIKIRLYTPSHSIRPKVLNFWNQHVGWAKLIAVASKRELLLQMTLGDSIAVQDIYDVGLSASKLCIAALNMGSLGFVWYDLPRQTSRYYETMRDVDAPTMDVSAGRHPGILGDGSRVH